MGREAHMTIRIDEQTQAPAVPEQAGAALPDRVPTVVDHIHTHGQRCYWDFRDAGWVCARD
jgi:hypothetical protein